MLGCDCAVGREMSARMSEISTSMFPKLANPSNGCSRVLADADTDLTRVHHNIGQQTVIGAFKNASDKLSSFDRGSSLSLLSCCCRSFIHL